MVGIIICLISGAALSLAFPGADQQWIAWFSAAPLIYFTLKYTWKKAILCGLAFGLGFFLPLLYWIAIFGKLPWIALGIFQALFVVLFALAVSIFGRRAGSWGRFLLVPALWVLAEWARSLGMYGFTWGDIGYSQYRQVSLIQISSVTGVWGVSFLVALSNSSLAGLAADGFKRRFSAVHVQAGITAVLILAVVLWGHSVAVDGTGTGFRTAVIQGNINPDVYGNREYQEKTWSVYEGMTLKAAMGNTQLIVWPEGVVPGASGLGPETQGRLAGLAQRVNAYLLVGGHDMDAQGRVYNSVYMIEPGTGLEGRYAKVHLVPFGEFVPMRKYLPFLKQYQVTPFDQYPGPGHNLTHMATAGVGTSICFESIFPYISREMTRNGANILCVVTNDSWFLRTSAAEQHMAMSVFRAVENRRFLVRAAATGISCFIGPDGRVLSRTELFVPAVLSENVDTRWDISLYTRCGDWLLWLLLVLTAAEILYSLVRGNRGKK